MAKADILSQIYAPRKQDCEFNFNALCAPPLLSMISVEDIKYLNYLVTSPKYTSKIDYKYDQIRQVMANRGFRKLHAGTNRVVYVNDDIPTVVIKVCTNSIALTDAPNEYKNQFYLAPFVTKVFEYSPCGTVGLFERVEPITSRQEFMSISDNIYELLTKKILGEFILEDIGTQYFMNWGMRIRDHNGMRIPFGPVLIDFPTMFKLDGKKLFCNRLDPITRIPCTGIIDYDSGFNHLKCPVCGKQYQARQLAKYEEDNQIVIANKCKGDCKMVIEFKRGNVVEAVSDGKSSKIIERKESKEPEIKVQVTGKKESVETNTENKPVRNRENDIMMLRHLFAMYPQEAAELIQSSMYTIMKSDIDNGIDVLDLEGREYIKADLVKSVYCKPKGTTWNFNYGEDTDNEESDVPQEEPVSENIDEEEMVKPTEEDFDENGKFIIEKEEDNEEETSDSNIEELEDQSNEVVDARQDYVDDESKLPFIDKKKASKF